MGGFYVGRYEAGLAMTITETTTTQAKGSSVYNLSGVPQSKAEVDPWNFIDWTHSSDNAKIMYNTNYVNSGLITGTQWDVILNTMISKLGMTTANMINSTSWGNYNNDTLTFTGLSSIFVSSTTQYPFGNTSVTGSNLYRTGECTNSMKYGISDIAGNLWEWTDENANVSTTYQTEMRRSGGLNDSGSTYAACSRHADGIAYTENGIGFRVVLYMK